MQLSVHKLSLSGPMLGCQFVLLICSLGSVDLPSPLIDIFIFHVYLCFAVPFSFVITCWERPDLIAYLCVMFSCIFVTFLLMFRIMFGT